MLNKKVKISALLLLCVGLTGLQAQNAIPASGGNASGGGGTASYSENAAGSGLFMFESPPPLKDHANEMSVILFECIMWYIQ